MQPVATAILAIPILNEIPNIWQAVGGAVALSGIYIINRAHQQTLKSTSGL